MKRRTPTPRRGSIRLQRIVWPACWPRDVLDIGLRPGTRISRPTSTRTGATARRRFVFVARSRRWTASAVRLTIRRAVARSIVGLHLGPTAADNAEFLAFICNRNTKD